jgi:hypothetical protein
MIFPQLFQPVSRTCSYLIASRRGAPAASGVSWLTVPRRTWHHRASERGYLATGTIGFSSTRWPAGRTCRAWSRSPSASHEHGRGNRHEESTWTMS